MKYFLTALILTLTSVNGYASSIKGKMRNNASDVKTLMLFALKDKKITSSEKRSIKRALERLQTRFNSLEDHFQSKGITYQYDQKNMLQYLSLLSDSIEKDAGGYTKSLIRVFPRFCFSCHRHDGLAIPGLSNLSKYYFSDDLEYGEYLIMSRHYKKAQQVYFKVLTSKHLYSQLEKESALKRYLQLSINQGDSPKKIMAKLYTLKSSIIKDDIKLAISTLSSLKSFSPMKLNNKNIQRSLNQYHSTLSLGNSNSEKIIKLSMVEKSIDFALRNKKITSQMPVALYWLGIIEDELNYNLYATSDQFYFLNCIEKYSKHNYAKKCFQTYKQKMIESFSGSLGTNIPERVKKEIQRLEKIVN